ncbi:MAG: hypothetical protein H6605_05280 [Flavobacteriales bacterium]|nr:hypothetical protein [Flavobacteriales bacterium]
MVGRSWTGGTYRFGFNEQENDDELKGKGNSIDFLLRTYDSRIGRFMSLDPIASKFAWNSPYVFAENKVLENRELEGGETINATTYLTRNLGYVMILQIGSKAGSLQFNRSVSASGGVTPNGISNISNTTDFTQTPEYRLLGRGKGAHNYWGTFSRNNGFNNTSLGGNLFYNSYRPILWKSSNDGLIVNPPVTSVTNQKAFQNDAYRIIGDPTSGNSGFENVVRAFNRRIQNVIANSNSVIPINNRQNTQIAVIDHPDSPGQNINITQFTIENGNTVTTGSNFIININGHTNNTRTLTDMRNRLQAANPNVSFNLNLSPTYNGGNAGVCDFSMSFTQTSTSQTSTLTRTIATDSSTGRNIPQN